MKRCYKAGSGKHCFLNGYSMERDEWVQYIKSWTVDDELCSIWVSYIDNCFSNNIPVILNFQHLAFLFELDHKILLTMVKFSEQFYREFSIPKRNGSTRNIDAPYPSLYSVQKWILDNILSKIRVHASAFGFVKKRSVVDHAKVHLGKKCLLKMDIKDFFPSINIKCRFRSKPATHSGTKLPLIPGETCHPFRRKVYHFSGHFRNAKSIS